MENKAEILLALLFCVNMYGELPVVLDTAAVCVCVCVFYPNAEAGEVQVS